MPTLFAGIRFKFTVEPAFGFDGVLDWAGQIRALAESDYEGYISVETHQRPKIESTRRYLERLQRLRQDATRE